MHLPDGFLSPTLTGVTLVGGGGVWGWSLYHVRDVPAERLARLGLGGAFLFVLQTAAFPLPYGGSTHLLGVPLATLWLGAPETLFLTGMSLALEALLLGHGGVLTWGANFLNIGVVGVLTTLAGIQILPRGWGAGVGAFFAHALGGALLALELVLSRVLPPSAAPGVVLLSLPAGVVEGMITGMVVGFRSPEDSP